MRLTLRDLRSLERRSMYSIFHPLDPDERLPRELLLEGRRWHRIDVRGLELLGALYLPGLMLAVVLMASAGLNAGVAFGVAGVIFLGLCIYVIVGKYR